MAKSDALETEWIKKERDTWLFKNISTPFFDPPHTAHMVKIEAVYEQSNQLGTQPLWEKYNKPGAFRTPNQVRTQPKMGCFFAWLVKKRQPSIIVEFGTAFGASGMYFLSGLEKNNYGKLLTFEPNTIWSEIAIKNLATISDRFQLVTGTFEDNIDAYLEKNQRIDLAFIDAIHTSEFVLPQFELVLERLAPNGLILLDDINFSKDMKKCWERLSQDARVRGSLTISNRVGLLEVA